MKANGVNGQQPSSAKPSTPQDGGPAAKDLNPRAAEFQPGERLRYVQQTKDLFGKCANEAYH